MNDFVAILNDNSKLFNFFFKFLVFGPSFHELVTCKSFYNESVVFFFLFFVFKTFLNTTTVFLRLSDFNAFSNATRGQ